MTEAPPPPAAEPGPQPKRGLKAHHYAAAVMSAIAFLCLGLIGLARFGVLTDTGRAYVVSWLDGLNLGSVGRLRVSGLEGDLWDRFSLARLAIEDRQGAWLDVRGLRVGWTPAELLSRHVHLQFLVADQVVLARQPQIGRSDEGPSGPSPVAVRIDRLQAHLVTEPALSGEQGRFVLDGGLDVERDGGVAGSVDAANLNHLGDGLSATFDLGVGKKVQLDAHARESRGGALAGLLGLPTGKAFKLDAKADGDVAAGALRVLAASGDTPIADAEGLWTRQGGQAHGWVSLAASRWTADYLAALGPRLSFTVRQDPAVKAVRPIHIALQSDNASLTAAGLVNMDKRRSDPGLSLQVRVKDLSRAMKTPSAGPGRFDGVIKGATDDWDLEGQLGVDRLAVPSYSLQTAKAVLHLARRKGELRLAATADGAGGAGSGLAAALAGARPHVTLDASRLADGRLMLRDIKAEGAGLTVSASGGRGLLGDLNFKGQARLTNLAAAQAGAKGAVDLKWSAGQSRARQPWKFSLDGQAADLATGSAPLDHLLGAKPRLALQAAYDDGAFVIAKADLTGSAARAGGSGSIAKDGALKLALDWTAEGPLDVGPLEIAGKAKGSAQIGGTLTEPRARLAADADRIDLPQTKLTTARLVLDVARDPKGVGGTFSLVASDAYGPAHAHAGFRVESGGLALDSLDAAAGGATAQGTVRLSSTDIQQADLTLAVGPGAFIAAGHVDARLLVADSAAGLNADLKLNAANVTLNGSDAVIRSAALTAKGPLSALPYAVNAELQADQNPLRLNGTGIAGRTDKGLAFTFNGVGRFRRADFRTVSPARITIAGEDRQARLDLALGGGHAAISADQNGASLDAKAMLTGVDLGALGEDLAGQVDADLTLSGQGARLGGRMQAHLKGARSRDAPAKLALNGQINAVLDGGRLSVDASVDGAAAGDHAQVRATLPAVATAQPFRIAIDETRPIDGDYQLSGELQPVWDLFFGDGRELGGQLTAKGGLGGTLQAPRLTGHGSLVHGHFEDAATGLKLREVAAEVDVQGQALDVQKFTANDAHSGTLSGQGRVDVGANGASALTLTARGFQLLDNELAKATASGTVTVARGADGKAKLSGALTIDRADISAETSRAPAGVVTMDVVERNKPLAAPSGLQAPSGGGPSMDLDVSIRAPRRVFVKGLGLDAELSLDAHVVGSTDNPILQGEARVVRGDYDFAGKRFTIDDRGVVYLATATDKIRLDLTATRDDPTLTAIIRIQGTAAKPQITLTSTPTLPDDEVLSQVLFGTSAAQLSPIEAAQLAAAVTTLATGGGFDVIGGLKNFARLDRLALGAETSTTGVNSGVTVSGGKYIGSKVYLELTGGGRQGPSAQVEYKATRALSLISQIGGEIGAKISVRWRRDYGKAPGAAR